MYTYRYRTCIAVVTAVSGFLCAKHTMAQSVKLTYKVAPGDSLYEDMKDKEHLFMQQRQGKKFPSYGNVGSIDSMYYDFDHISRPAVILVGHANCLPCTIQLPVLVRFARKRKYKNIDFVYITPDNAATARHEAGKKGYGRVKVFSFSRRYIIDTMATVSVFPTVYFIDKHGIAQVITAGGRIDKGAVPAIEEKWNHYIDMIYTD
jgi:hypothetical protein